MDYADWTYSPSHRVDHCAWLSRVITIRAFGCSARPAFRLPNTEYRTVSPFLNVEAWAFQPKIENSALSASIISTSIPFFSILSFSLSFFHTLLSIYTSLYLLSLSILNSLQPLSILFTGYSQIKHTSRTPLHSSDTFPLAWNASISVKRPLSTSLSHSFFHSIQHMSLHAR